MTNQKLKYTLARMIEHLAHCQSYLAGAGPEQLLNARDLGKFYKLSQQADQELRRTHLTTGLYGSGTCRFCGCTDDNCSQCVYETGRACHWVDKENTVCSNPSCVKLWKAVKK